MKIVLAACMAALATMAPTPSVTGTWSMGVQADHVVPVALVLQQEASTVTGRIAPPINPHGDRSEVSLSGELADGSLTLSVTMDHAHAGFTIAIAASLKDDGTLEGTVTTPHGKMPFTAERLRGSK